MNKAFHLFIQFVTDLHIQQILISTDNLSGVLLGRHS